MRRGVLAVAILAAALTLAACSSPGIADVHESGIPEGVELPGFDEGPYVVARADGSVLVVTFGSGSCPPTATSFSNDGTEMVISFEHAMEGPCTADISPTTHTFSAYDVGPTIPDRARILFAQLDDEVVVEVLRQ